VAKVLLERALATEDGKDVDAAAKAIAAHLDGNSSYVGGVRQIVWDATRNLDPASEATWKARSDLVDLVDRLKPGQGKVFMAEARKLVPEEPESKGPRAIGKPAEAKKTVEPRVLTPEQVKLWETFGQEQKAAFRRNGYILPSEVPISAAIHPTPTFIQAGALS